MTDARPPHFNLKKYIIMGFTIFQLIVLLVFTVLAGIALGAYNPNAAGHDPNVTKAAIILIMVSSIIAMLIQFMGFFGAYKEHFCMSCAYAVLSVLSFAFGIFNSIHSPSSWFSTVLSLLVAIVAILFTIDLRKIRLGQVGQPSVY